MNNNIQATNVSVNPPYPGYSLSVGSSGSNVLTMQKYLNALRAFYPQIIHLTEDGKFGNKTKQAVMQYQAAVGLKVDGIIGRNTWNAIVLDYNVHFPTNPDTYPGTPLKTGSSGQNVSHMQEALNYLAVTYTIINLQTVDGKFGTNMNNATKRFQKQFGLSVDGVIGQATWNKIVSVRNNTKDGHPDKVTTKYPGSPVKQGDSGENVRVVQRYINVVNKALGYIWANVTGDDIFGNATRTAVISFQGYFGLKIDGVVGSTSWGKIVEEFNETL